ncbi:MAG: hypothetical protein WCG50_18960 [Rhodoferax sp.]|uniref:hypothetical protein n=1 Tax=Rhodoferax sp. TaxID=50421 RepID=UPI00301837B6
MNHPITQAEEAKMYGIEVSEDDFYAAVYRAGEAYDADDLQVAAYELAKPILASLVLGDFHKVGELLHNARAATVTRRAEFECYGYITTPEFKA